VSHLGACALSAALLAAAAATASDVPRQTGAGLYVWGPAIAMTDGRENGGVDDAEEQDRFLGFCVEGPLRVRRVYFLAEPGAWDPRSVARLLRRSRESGIEVYAVPPGGMQDRWAAPLRRTGEGDCGPLLRFTHEIAAAGEPGARFSGVQLDIEFHRARARKLLLFRARVWDDDASGLAGSSRNRGTASAFLALQALTAVNRPDEEGFWRNFSSSKWVAWKTGTSFGLRDAWAVGVTPNYTIGVWAGNAGGGGTPGLTGLAAAAPILFDLLGAVDGGGPIARPPGGFKDIRVCRDSGFLATDLCPAETVAVPEESRFDRMCEFHQMVHLDASGRFRVDSRCEPVDRMRHEPWFVLPPVQEYFYRAEHAEYRPLPPVRADCGGGLAGERGSRVMSLVYPEPDMSVYVPVGLDGRTGEVVFEAVHRDAGATIHWHLDGRYVASTRVFHQIAAAPGPGPHRLVLMDDDGRRIERAFDVVSPARRGDR